MHTLLTRSGAVYNITGRSSKGLLEVSRNGAQEQRMVAIYPDRLPAFEAAASWDKLPDGRLAGFNKAGVRTCLLVVDQVRKGMILVSAKGLRSTEIIAVQ